MKISLFIPCYVDQFYPKVGIATLELLEKMGCEVQYPLGQTCCGQPMANSGFETYSKNSTENFIDNFSDAEYIVSPSGSCVHHIRDHILPSGSEKPAVSRKVYELTDFLNRFGDKNKLKGRYYKKVGIHKSCHGLRSLHLGTSSELNLPAKDLVGDLLSRFEGLDLLTPERTDECCGFGGTFAVSEEAVSVSMGNDRIQGFEDMGVEEITATDMSCLMHLEGLLKRQKSPIVIKHVAEILNDGIS